MGLLLWYCGQIAMACKLVEVLEMAFKLLGVLRAGLYAIFLSCASIHLQRRSGQIVFFWISFYWFFICIVSVNFCNGLDRPNWAFVVFRGLLRRYCV